MKKLNLVGQTFGRLKVLEEDIKREEKEKEKTGKHLNTFWLCQCSCEAHNIISVSRRNLTNGNTKSCGCLHYENVLMAYPYLKKYEFSAYVPTCGSGSCDIYIKMPYKYKGEEVTVSLYCPLEALREKNPDMIYQRHFGYNSDYYKTNLEAKEKILSVLNSQKYKAFCKKVM